MKVWSRRSHGSSFRPTTGRIHARDPRPLTSILNNFACQRAEPESSEAPQQTKGRSARTQAGEGKVLCLRSDTVTRHVNCATDRHTPRHRGGRQVKEGIRPTQGGLKLVMEFARRVGTTELLTKLAVGRVETCPFDRSRNRTPEESGCGVSGVQRNRSGSEEQQKIGAMSRSTTEYSRPSCRRRETLRWRWEVSRSVSVCVQAQDSRDSPRSTHRTGCGVC